VVLSRTCLATMSPILPRRGRGERLGVPATDRETKRGLNGVETRISQMCSTCTTGIHTKDIELSFFSYILKISCHMCVHTPTYFRVQVQYGVYPGTHTLSAIN